MASLSRKIKDLNQIPFASECIEWQKFKDRDGYGQRKWKGKVHRAHRVAYVEAYDLAMEDIDGQVVRHRCDKPACVNPQHLELGTQAENVKDAWARDRGKNPSFKGASHWKSKLTAEQVREIRSRHKPRCQINGSTALGREFGVSCSTISAIASGKAWSHLPMEPK